MGKNDEFISMEEYIDKLPPEAGYSIEDGLTWKETKIMDGLPYIENRIKLHTDAGDEDWVRLGVIHDESDITSRDVKISDIEDIDWFDFDNRCRLNPDCAKGKVYLAHILKSMLSDEGLKTVHKYQVEKFGCNKIDLSDDRDLYCYNTGSTLILPQKKDIAKLITMKESDCEWVLKEDTESYTEEEAATGITDVIALYRNVGLPVFAFIIAALLKSLFRECGIPPKFILYVCGKKDRKKTAYITLLSPMFNVDDDTTKLVVQFNTSNYNIDKLMNDCGDAPIILDNVYISEDSDINKRIKKRFEEDVQCIGDDIGKLKADKRYKPLASIIATGEYDGICNPSTITRYLTVPFGDDLKDSEAESLLHEYQSEPLRISTFYYYFLQWAINHVRKIKASIKDLLRDFREDSGDLDMSSKLKERYFVLLTSYMLFLEYCVAKGFMKEDETDELQAEFSDQLLLLCRRHNRTITEKENQEGAQTDDFFRLIKYWYRNGEFDMAKDGDGKKDLKYREALVHDKYLCLRTKPLMKKINKSYPLVKLNAVISQLVAKKILKSDSDKNTTKIRGLRFLKIPLDKLE
ncbi:MAG: hypothetical protein FWD71_11375 [Oscillospiraceae bacterium]|nr:hypothetical protein [Oscillospiraceae bacterium]